MDGDRGSQRAAVHVSRFAEKIGREFGLPITAVDWYWLVSHGSSEARQRRPKRVHYSAFERSGGFISRVAELDDSGS